MFEKLLLDLQNYTAFSEEETRDKLRTIEFVQQHVDCLLRSNLMGHLTGSAWVVDAATHSRALLVEHVKLKTWLQPGGHADGEVNIQQVASTELWEETGIKAEAISDRIFDISVHSIPAHKDVPSHFHYDLRYLFIVDQQQPLILSDESHAIRWFDFSELPALGCDSSVLQMAAKTPKWLKLQN